MKRKWTRRKFLETSLKGSIVVGSGAAAGMTPPARLPAAQAAKSASAGLEDHARTVLKAAMDEIIPAGDGMPSASAVGGVEYLDRLARQDIAARRDLSRSLAALDELSRGQSRKDFISLARAERVEILKKLEKSRQPKLFGNLRDYVYESYYTQPKIWKLIGYEFYPTNQHGPRMKPFDESILASVRKMPKFYREAE